MTKLYIRLFAAIIFLAPALSYANYTIAPVRIEINRQDKIASLTIKNDSDRPKYFQVSVHKLGSVDGNGKQHYQETKDLIVTPVMFSVDAVKSQLIRVALKDNVMHSSHPRGYQLSIKELPHNIEKEGNNIHFVTEFKVPVSVKDDENSFVEEEK